MKNILILTLVSVLLGSCASFPGSSWDANLYNKSPIVLRVDIIPGHDNLRRHRQFPVRVLKVYKNTTDLDIPDTLELASTAEWGGLPACGECTVYARHNKSDSKSTPVLALDEPSGVYIHKHTPAYSHHVFPNNSPVPDIPHRSSPPDQPDAQDEQPQETPKPQADTPSPEPEPEPEPEPTEAEASSGQED